MGVPMNNNEETSQLYAAANVAQITGEAAGEAVAAEAPAGAPAVEAPAAPAPAEAPAAEAAATPVEVDVFVAEPQEERISAGHILAASENEAAPKELVTPTDSAVVATTAAAAAATNTTSVVVSTAPAAAEAPDNTVPEMQPGAPNAPATSNDTPSANASSNPNRSGGEKKRKSFRWSNLTYMTRVTMSFAAIAAMTLLVAVGVLSVVWGNHFNSYARENARATADAASTRIAQAYVEEGYQWTEQVTVAASYVSATYPGVGVVVTDNKGTVRYDSSLGADVSTDISDTPSIAPESSTLAAVSYIKVDGTVIGQVRIWSFGSDSFLRKADETFRDNSYQAMAIASIIAIALATIIGFMFARNLVSPINAISRTAKSIKEGNLTARTGLTGEDEIARLGETFDAMAQAEEDDRELERRLTTDVAHELRTPLMAIQATVEAIIDGVYKPTQDRLNQVNSEVTRLSRLVDALLRLSRLENRSNPMKEEVINVGELISGLVKTHEAFVNDSGLTLKYEMEENVIIKGDADMIRQATANLISNAVRYTPEGGTVTVRVKRGELMADIVVEDTGIGLSPEEARKVFSRFWRADAGRNRDTGGLGIGLAVVKEIVDRHKGWVQVEGKKGEGARFTIRIPLYDPADARNKGRAKGKPRPKR